MSTASTAPADRRLLRAIGARVRELRAAGSMTQGQLAERIGRTQANVSRIEAGEHNVTVVVLADVVAGLGTTWRGFFEGVDA